MIKFQFFDAYERQRIELEKLKFNHLNFGCWGV